MVTKNSPHLIATALLPSQHHDDFKLAVFRSASGSTDLAVYGLGVETFNEGVFSNTRDLLVRMHSQCFTGDVFSSSRCDCGSQLSESLRLIAENGVGLVLYDFQEGRGIGLAQKIRAYSLQESGVDTVDANELLGHAADLRSYDLHVEVLHWLGVKEVCLLTNNPEKCSALESNEIMVRRLPLNVGKTKHNMKYLETKRLRMGHIL